MKIIGDIFTFVGFIFMFKCDVFVDLNEYIHGRLDEFGIRINRKNISQLELVWKTRIKEPVALSLLLIGSVLNLLSNFM